MGKSTNVLVCREFDETRGMGPLGGHAVQKKIVRDAFSLLLKLIERYISIA